MNFSLNTYDRIKIQRLAAVLKMNNDAVRIFSAYLAACPNFITADMIQGICNEYDIPEENAFSNLLIAACGLDIENNTTNRQLANSYIVPAIHKLSVQQYIANPYYKHIHIPEVQFGNWELKYMHYNPYEAFVCNSPLLKEDFKEIPQIVFFDTTFSFPAITQYNNEWMAIKPNEIETMQEAIQQISGNVVTFGLGLGYFAYMVSEKKTVRQITIVEKDKTVISLFQTHILPQFPHHNKIRITQADAFEYVATQMPEQKYNYAFTDLWHDVSDGYPLYLKMKKLESLHPETVFLYWIEDALLSRMRWNLFHQIYDTLFTENTKQNHEIHVSLPIGSYEQLIALLKNSSLKKLARGKT